MISTKCRVIVSLLNSFPEPISYLCLTHIVVYIIFFLLTGFRWLAWLRVSGMLTESELLTSWEPAVPAEPPMTSRLWTLKVSQTVLIQTWSCWTGAWLELHSASFFYNSNRTSRDPAGREVAGRFDRQSRYQDRASCRCERKAWSTGEVDQGRPGPAGRQPHHHRHPARTLQAFNHQHHKRRHCHLHHWGSQHLWTRHCHYRCQHPRYRG